MKYKNVNKDGFVDRYKCPDIVDNCQKFLRIMKDLKQYLVEFGEDGSIKTKDYSDNCGVDTNIRQPVILIIHNKCIFFMNNKIQRIWIFVEDIFLQPKRRGQGIIVSDFFFLFGQLNLSSLPKKRKKYRIDKTRLSVTKVIELFEYKKTNKSYYWIRLKLYKQVINKVLLIAETLYSSYSFLFLFDNATSYFVYI